MLGIAPDDKLEEFWSSEVHPKIGTDTLTLPQGVAASQGVDAPRGADVPKGTVTPRGANAPLRL
jgi:hypothetical protein